MIRSLAIPQLFLLYTSHILQTVVIQVILVQGSPNFSVRGPHCIFTNIPGLKKIPMRVPHALEFLLTSGSQAESPLHQKWIPRAASADLNPQSVHISDMPLTLTASHLKSRRARGLSLETPVLLHKNLRVLVICCCCAVNSYAPRALTWNIYSLLYDASLMAYYGCWWLLPFLSGNRVRSATDC